jgi:hypothetical protein
MTIQEDPGISEGSHPNRKRRSHSAPFAITTQLRSVHSHLTVARSQTAHFLMYAHLGKLLHPMKLSPALGPFFAVLLTSKPPHFGHLMASECLSFRPSTCSWNDAAGASFSRSSPWRSRSISESENRTRVKLLMYAERPLVITFGGKSLLNSTSSPMKKTTEWSLLCSTWRHSARVC